MKNIGRLYYKHMFWWVGEGGRLKMINAESEWKQSSGFFLWFIDNVVQLQDTSRAFNQNANQIFDHANCVSFM